MFFVYYLTSLLIGFSSITHVGNDHSFHDSLIFGSNIAKEILSLINRVF